MREELAEVQREDYRLSSEFAADRAQTRLMEVDWPPPMAADWDRANLHRIWLHIQRRPWRTLAVVPADDRRSSYDVASIITALGVHHGSAVSLADVRDLRMAGVAKVLEAVGEAVTAGQRVVFAMRSIAANLSTVPLARAADGVILCVSLGSTGVDAVEEAIQHIGRERFHGSMLVHETSHGRGAVIAPRRLREPS